MFSFLKNVLRPRKGLEECLEDPIAAKEELKAEQRELADEIEQLFRAYDERLESLAQRTHELPLKDIEREAAALKIQQDALRRALRRLDAAAKSTAELERELDEWQEREQDGPLHADHPTVRTEILRSELASRGIQRMPVVDEEDEEPEFMETTVRASEVGRRESPIENFQSDDVRLSTPDARLPTPDASFLVAAIREATREAERWHAIPADEHNEDAIDQVKHLKELHALLKQLDRDRGIERDRLDMAVNTREFVE